MHIVMESSQLLQEKSGHYSYCTARRGGLPKFTLLIKGGVFELSAVKAHIPTMPGQFKK